MTLSEEAESIIKKAQRLANLGVTALLAVVLGFLAVALVHGA